MIYYKVNDGNKVVSFCTGAILPAGAIELTQEQYDAGIAFIRLIPNKEGMMLVEDAEGVYSYVPDPDYVPQPDGSYLHPFPWTEDAVPNVGEWFAFDDGNIWEWIKTGTGAETVYRFDVI